MLALSARARCTASSCPVPLMPASTSRREGEEVVGVRVPDGVHLAACVELLGGEGADRLEQRVALARPDHAHESLLDERVELARSARDARLPA